jgi:hypothetical protein
VSLVAQSPASQKALEMTPLPALQAGGIEGKIVLTRELPLIRGFSNAAMELSAPAHVWSESVRRYPLAWFVLTARAEGYRARLSALGGLLRRNAESRAIASFA